VTGSAYAGPCVGNWGIFILAAQVGHREIKTHQGRCEKKQRRSDTVRIAMLGVGEIIGTTGKSLVK